jgi:hypothetical protein
MSFIDLGQDFADAKEPEVAPEGKEYDLLVKSVEENKDDAKKKHSIRLMIEIQHGKDEGPYRPVFLYLGIPNKKWDEERDNEKDNDKGTASKFKNLNIKRALYFFGLEWENITGFTPLDFVGQSARGGLAQEEYQGNRSNKIILPNLPSP